MHLYDKVVVCREMTLPIAKVLGVPFSNVFANRMNWQADDVTGVPTKLVGFDTRELTAHQGGKPQAIARLREMFPYETVGSHCTQCRHSFFASAFSGKWRVGR